MLFELTDDLLTDLTLEETQALELILGARRRGYHLLLGSPKLFASLPHLVSLSPCAQAILGTAARQQVQKAGLRDAVRCLVRVTYDIGPTTAEVAGVGVLNLPLSHFRDFCSADESVVLGENARDAHLAMKMAEYYAASQGMPNAPLRGRLDGGGGSTTADAFRRYREDPRLCICVVDSDSKAPDAPVGPTAAAAMAEVDPWKPWAMVLATQCREVENTLPTQILERAVQHDPRRLGQIPDLERLCSGVVDANLRDYCDFKDGTRLKWVFSLADGPVRRYWIKALPSVLGLPQVREDCVARSRCHTPDACSCWILSDFGDRLLDHCLDALDNLTHQKVDEALCDVTRPHWSHVGSVVFSWACGTARRVV